jgi:hypothetical protein
MGHRLTTLEFCCAPKVSTERVARDPHACRANSNSLLGSAHPELQRLSKESTGKAHGAAADGNSGDSS